MTQARDRSDPARGDELPFLRGPLPGWLERSRTVLGPGAALAPDARPWAGALVIVERGAIELVGRGGGRVRLPAGAVLWLAGRSLRAVRNPGGEPAILVAIARSVPTVTA